MAKNIIIRSRSIVLMALYAHMSLREAVGRVLLLVSRLEEFQVNIKRYIKFTV